MEEVPLRCQKLAIRDLNSLVEIVSPVVPQSQFSLMRTPTYRIPDLGHDLHLIHPTFLRVRRISFDKSLKSMIRLFQNKFYEYVMFARDAVYMIYIVT